MISTMNISEIMGSITPGGGAKEADEFGLTLEHLRACEADSSRSSVMLHISPRISV